MPNLLLALILALSGIGVLTNFEGGSIGKVEQVSLMHLRCAVQGQSDQDHRNRQANWYYFELTNASWANTMILRQGWQAKGTFRYARDTQVVPNWYSLLDHLRKVL